MGNRVKNFIKLRGDKNELDKLQSMMTYTYGGKNKNVEQGFFWRLLLVKELWEPEDVWYFRSNREMLEVSFESFWETPKQVFEAIRNRFTSLTFGGYFADECLGNNCGLIMGNKNHVEIIDIGDGSGKAVDFAEKVWGMLADEVYVGKTLEDVIKRPTPTDFVEVGLVDEK
jgi:hypothetical protein